MKPVFACLALVAALAANNSCAQDTASPFRVGNILTTSANPSNWMPSFVVAGPREVTVQTGTRDRDQSILVYPFAYRWPLKLKNDVHTLLHKIPAGATGFDMGDVPVTGRYDQVVGAEHVMCFFRTDQGRPYGVPECMRHLGLLVNWTTAIARNNVPKFMVAGDPIFGTPDVETRDVLISHEFNFQLVLGEWREKSVRLRWMSEGSEIEHVDLPLLSDGTALIETDEGTIRLAPVQSESSIGVAFVPKPDAPLSRPPDPVGPATPNTGGVDDAAHASGHQALEHF